MYFWSINNTFFSDFTCIANSIKTNSLQKIKFMDVLIKSTEKYKV